MPSAERPCRLAFKGARISVWSPSGRSVLDTAPSKHRGIGRCPSPHSAVSQVISELGLQIWNFSCLSFSPHLSDLTHKGTGTCNSLVQGLQASVLVPSRARPWQVRPRPAAVVMLPESSLRKGVEVGPLSSTDRRPLSRVTPQGRGI